MSCVIDEKVFPRKVWVAYPEDPTGENYALTFKEEPLPVIEDSVEYVRKDVVDELVGALEGFVNYFPERTLESYREWADVMEAGENAIKKARE